jgi:creatinine amidohydrolase
VNAASYRLGEITWFEFERFVREEVQPVVFLPTGSTEQHGPHLPLSTDVVLPQAIAERVAERVGGLVAPGVPYGYKSQPKSGGGNHFPGTLSLDASTFVAVVRDVINELARHGIRKVVVFDGHMENQWFIVEAIDLALRDCRREGIHDLRILKLGYWTFISKETEAALFPDGFVSWELEHAAVMETSVMLHLRPDLVRSDLLPNHGPAEFPVYDTYPYDRSVIPPDGVLSSAAGATAAKGELVLAQIIPAIADAIHAAFDSPTEPTRVA